MFEERVVNAPFFEVGSIVHGKVSGLVKPVEYTNLFLIFQSVHGTRSHLKRRNLKPSISIVGAGALGSSLAYTLFRSGCKIRQILSRSPESAGRLVKETQCELPTRLGEKNVIAQCDAAILCVPDYAVRDIAARFDFSNAATVLHCSGALTSDALGISGSGAAVGSINPVQTFPKRLREQFEKSPLILKGVYHIFEGDERAFDMAVKLVECLQGHILRINKNDKILHHVACVFVSNFTNLLLNKTAQIYRHLEKNETETFKVLRPLFEDTVQNAFEYGTVESLTGPAARGETEILRQHLAALKQRDPELLDLYKAFTNLALKMTQQNHDKNASTYETLQDLLADEHE